tara:strand:+ start:134 stop:643 length:510 start_codon:yes stop_codon:yes gene_type:complete
MAEEEAGAEEQAGAPSQSSGAPSRYFVLILLILLLEAAVGYYVLDRAVPAPEDLSEETTEEEEEEKEWRPPIYYEEMKEMVFSPSDSHGSLMVQVSLVFEVDSQAVVDEFSKRHFVLWDIVLGRMERFSAEVVRDPWKQAVKEDVKQTLNHELKNGEVIAVFVTDFVVQ